jgi:hypothetical protein
MYPKDMKNFIDRGGFIAWGVVPTTDKIKDATLEELKGKLESGLTSLEKAGIPGDKLRKQSLITPSCGTGSLCIEDAMKAFSLLKDLRNSYVKG